MYMFYEWNCNVLFELILVLRTSILSYVLRLSLVLFYQKALKTFFNPLRNG